MRKRIFSRLMAMFMAVALLSTSALAVEVNQEYINNLNKNVQQDEYGNQFVSVPQGDDGDNEYRLVDDVKTDYTLKFSGDREVTLDLNGYTIDHQNKAGAVISVGAGTTLTIDDTSGLKDEDGYDKGTITGGTGDEWGSYNYLGKSETRGGGISMGDNSKVTLNSGTIRGNTATEGGGVAVLSGASLAINGGNITNNIAKKWGGGIYGEGYYNSNSPFDRKDASITINGGKISENEAWHGGGICLFYAGNLDLNTGTVSKNKADEGAGILVGYNSITSFNMNGGTVSENIGTGVEIQFRAKAQLNSGAICSNTGDAVVAKLGSSVDLENSKTAISEEHFNVTDPAVAPTCTETGLTEGSHCDTCGMVFVAQEVVPATGHTSGEAVRENEVAAQPGVPGSYDLVVRCTVCNKIISSTPGTIPALPMPVDFGDFPGGVGAGADTAIDDEATPLAGILTLADLLNALYEHEEIEDSVLPKDFQWADHVYAQAICWGLEGSLVVDTEDDPLDPDELLTVALLREVLVNFVEYKGIDFTVTVDGEDDELVLDLGERLTAFYPQLEAALAKKAA